MQYIPRNMGWQQHTQGKYVRNNSTGGMPNLWKQERDVQTTRFPFDYQQNGHNFSIILQLLLKLYLPVRQCRPICSRTSHFLSSWILDLLGFWISFKHEYVSETGSGPILKWKNCKSPTELRPTERISSYTDQPKTCFQNSKTFYHCWISDGGQSPQIR